MPKPLLQDTALRYFLEVVRSGSATVASERLHVAASAVSRQIAALERTLGTTLFERHPRGMVPTQAGEILAAYARRAGLEEERALQEIQALQGMRMGLVRIAASEAFANLFLPRLIVAFRQQHEGIFFELDAQPPAVVSAQVREGVVDIGLRFSQAPEADIELQFSQPAPVLALMRPDHPLAGAAGIGLRTMSEHPLALPGPQTTLRQMIDAACARQQIRLRPALVSNNMSTLHSFAIEGGGLSVSSGVAVRQLRAEGRLAAVPVTDAGLDLRTLEVQTLAGRTLPRAVQAFLEHLKQHLPEAM